MFECEACGEPCAVEVFCGGVRVCLCGGCEAEDGRSPVSIAEARARELEECEEEEEALSGELDCLAPRSGTPR